MKKKDVKKEIQDVKFSLLGVESDVGPIVGFAICYRTKKEAEFFFSFVHRYITAASTTNRLFSVNFTTKRDTVKLDLNITIKDETLGTSIDGISIEDLNKLKLSLKNYKYYFIVSGNFDVNNNFEPLSPSEFHMFKADINIDGVQIFSSKDSDWPKNNPLDS